MKINIERSGFDEEEYEIRDDKGQMIMLLWWSGFSKKYLLQPSKGYKLLHHNEGLISLTEDTGEDQE